MSKYPVDKSEEAWKQELSAEEYRILRQAGTEYPFTGQYNNHFEAGTYHCKGCGAPLYASSAKFDSCLLYTSPSPRDLSTSRMPSSA